MKPEFLKYNILSKIGTISKGAMGFLANLDSTDLLIYIKTNVLLNVNGFLVI